MTDVPVLLTYLQEMNEQEASDLYLAVGQPPTLRVNDELIIVSKEPLTHDMIDGMLSSVLTSRQRSEFESTMELNMGLDMFHYGRFRFSFFKQKQSPALVVRRIVSEIPDIDDLHLPPILKELAMEKRGMILLTGMTGAGKSTTLAAMINYRNQNAAGHIISIEDPIEFFHKHKKSVVTQREIGSDTESYAVALKNALRQRPDVIMVGEIRDRQVMEHALMSAETGHLCLSTLHTNNTYQAIERIVNLFPDEYDKQIRLNMSTNLKAIISQRLVPGKHGGVVPALEIMLNQGLIRELILNGKIAQIVEVMEKNNANGMCSFDQSLLALIERDMITPETALTFADKPTDLKIKLQNMSIGGEGGVASMQSAAAPYEKSETIKFYE